MLYMVIERFRNADATPIGERFVRPLRRHPVEPLVTQPVQILFDRPDVLAPRGRTLLPRLVQRDIRRPRRQPSLRRQGTWVTGGIVQLPSISDGGCSFGQ